MDRQQSVLLILGKVKLKGEQIAELLISCDQNKLTSNLVNSLLASLPNEQEMTMVQAYDGKIENLGDAEKYFKALEKVNGYEERLQALKFKSIYPETKEFLTQKVALLSQFFEKLQGDTRIVTILENALAVGNFVNGTGFKGGAWGFKISNIDKMTEVKSFDGKLNLLMYLINRIEKKEGKEVVKVDEDLKIFEECSKTPVSQLISEITDLKRGIKTLEKSIKVQTADEHDKIKETIEPFFLLIQPEISELEKQVRDLETMYKTIAEYFCEDPRKTPSDEFAKQILTFKRNCITAKITFSNLRR